MKKVIYINLIFFLIGNSLFAQSVSVGAKYAANSNWLLNEQVSLDDHQSYSMTIGHDFGAIAHFKFSDYIGIKTEIIANTVNQKYKLSDINISEYASYLELKTLDIPIFLTVGNKFYIEAGYIISVLNKAETEIAYPSGSTFDDVKNDYTQVNQSVSLGLVKAFEFSENYRFLMGIRVSKGVNDIQGINGFGLTKEDLETEEQNIGKDFNSDNFSTKPLVIGAYFAFTLAI